MLMGFYISYTENWVTDSEFSSLAPRFQEQIRRTSQNRSMGGGWNGGYGYPSTPGGQGNRFKRLGESHLYHWIPWL